MSRKPKPGPRTQVQIGRVAEAVVAGKTVTEIARAEGVSRVTASRLANSDECSQIIAGLVQDHSPRIERLFELALDVVEEGLQAKDHKTLILRVRKADKEAQVTEEEVELCAPPDHYARLGAAKRLIELLTAGRPKPLAKPAADTTKKGMSLEELEAAAKG